MQVTVKLYAGFRQYLPEGAAGSAGIGLEVEQGVTPHQLLRQLNVPVAEAHLVLINGVFVEPDNRDRAVLKGGDVLAAWPAVAGG